MPWMESVEKGCDSATLEVENKLQDSGAMDGTASFRLQSQTKGYYPGSARTILTYPSTLLSVSTLIFEHFDL
jgi:hypothetical protein